MTRAVTEAVVCCLFGMFGIHKFIKNRLFVGFAYLFTFGLFGFGWLHDALRAVLVVLDLGQKKTELPQSSSLEADLPLSERSQKILNTFTMVYKIFALACIAIACIAALPSWACFLGFFAIVLLLPIPQWQAMIHRVVNKDMKRVIAAFLVLAMLICVVPTDTQSDISQPVNNTFATTTSTSATSTTATTVTTTTTTTAPTTAPTTTVTTTTSTSTIALATTVTTTTTTSTAATTTVTTTTFTTAAPTTTIATTMTPTTTTEPPHVHEFADATCNDPETCVSCGETNGYALGHEFSDGTCSRCGAEDPDYVREEMVWIPINGGTKYHSKKSCSQMIDPEYVTISEAIARDFEPCGRCYR